jgi:hypothetical protein
MRDTFAGISTAQSRFVVPFATGALVGCQVRVAQRHLRRAVTHEIPTVFSGTPRERDVRRNGGGGRANESG